MKVEKDAAGLKACLKAPNDTTLTCVVAAPRTEKDKVVPEAPEDWAAR